MSTTHFHLSESLVNHDLMDWYNNATVGDAAVVALPRWATAVRLLRSPNGTIHWWPLKDRGVTMPIEHALQRLRMLRETATPPE